MLEELRRVYDLLAQREGLPVPPAPLIHAPGSATVSERFAAEIRASKPSLPTAATPGAPDPEMGTSLLGAQAWQQYLDTLEGDLAMGAAGRAPPEDLVRARMEGEGALRAMRDRIEQIEQYKDRMLQLEARGRDFRANIGRAVDDLGGDLSGKARERDLVAAERDKLEQERDDLSARKKAGDHKVAGRLDAVAWEIAACDEVLRKAVAECEDLEFQLLTLEKRLDRLNEELESDQVKLVAEINAGFAALAEHDRTLRKAATVVERVRKSQRP
jgi:predicted  nucleic acid-binding Zn-ribbon protein